jgi:5-methylcytosine-specific restriction endonuclease McrA
MARHVLGGPADDGRASYQIAIDVCEDCRRARQLADGEAIDVSKTAMAMARCDAQWLPSAHVGDDAAERASQDVAPMVRRSVLRRDHHRCQVPGCRHATYVDLHHIQTRADGGQHDAENLLTLCAAHHRALHDGTLQITGSVSKDLTVCHADGTLYGAAISAPSVLVHARAFQALRGLGFGERDARQALESTRAALGNDAELEAVLRHCLDLLSARAWTRAS